MNTGKLFFFQAPNIIKCNEQSEQSKKFHTSGCYSDGSQIKLLYSNKQFPMIQEFYLGTGENQTAVI